MEADRRRVVDALVRFHEIRREAVAGTVVQRWRRVVATATPGSSLGWVQRVVGLGPDDDAVVAAVATFFARHGVARWEADVVGTPDDQPALTAVLLGRGLAPGRRLDVLVGPVGDETPPPPRGVVVAPVDDGATFADLLLAGFGDDVDDGERRGVMAWATDPALRCATVTVDGRPAGAAALVVHDGIGLMANAAVLPTARGRGAHAALLTWRAEAAHQAGVDLLAAVAAPGGASHRNQQRAGLTVAAPLTIWAHPAR